MGKGCQDVTDMGQTLLDIARSHDCGEVAEILTANAIGIEWLDSNRCQWFMQWPSVQSLFPGWNGVGQVNWFFDGQMAEGGNQRCIVRVSPQKMRELRQCYSAIKGGPIDE